MVRPLRIEFPSAVYHVTSRGNARMRIYEDDADRTEFFSVLERVLQRFHWLMHTYCLMDNHYHLLIETPEANLSTGMRQLNGVFTQRYNRRHKRVGHLLHGRFKAILVDRDNYLLELCRYVVLNPVRAKMVKRAQDYRWSSYRATAGLERAPDWLTCDWVLSQFGKQRPAAQRRYRTFVAAGVNALSPWAGLKAQTILGTDEFIAKLRRPPPRQLKEVRREQRYLDRPALEKLFGYNTLLNREKRNRRIVEGNMRYGYTQAQIASYLGLHYSMVSKVIKAEMGDSRFMT